MEVLSKPLKTFTVLLW